MLASVANQVNANARAAVALMTAWLSDPDLTSKFPSETMMDLVADLGDGDQRVGLIRLVVGLNNLAGRLLIRVETLTGEPAEVILRQIAVQHADD